MRRRTFLCLSVYPDPGDWVLVCLVATHAKVTPDRRRSLLLAPLPVDLGDQPVRLGAQLLCLFTISQLLLLDYLQNFWSSLLQNFGHVLS